MPSYHHVVRIAVSHARPPLIEHHRQLLPRRIPRIRNLRFLPTLHDLVQRTQAQEMAASVLHLALPHGIHAYGPPRLPQLAMENARLCL